MALAAIAALLTGLWAALLRVGWQLPELRPDLELAHGPLMVCGFLGTLISLERAVALGRPWAYLAPAATGAGAMALVAGLPGITGPLLIFAGSVLLVGVFGAIVRRQRTLFTLTMAGGALAWAVGNALWLSGLQIFEMVHWWMAFLVLTIVGERLELSRFLPPRKHRTSSFAVIVAVYVSGLVAMSLAWEAGPPLMGLGMIAMAGWLVRYDLVRVTIRGKGLPRLAAVCLAGGYFWLAVAGVQAVLLAWWPAIPDLRYDAELHTVFLGFVFSMIFAHAPIILPAVTGLQVPYRRYFYAHVILLHASLLCRIVADDFSLQDHYRWAGLGNVSAIVLFLGGTAYSLLAAQRQRGRRGASVPVRSETGVVSG